jgi:hypothetical protein
VGGKGHVRFIATTSSTEIFAGTPGRRENGKIIPPTGTFYKFVNGKLVPIPTPRPNQPVGTPVSTKSTASTLTTKSAPAHAVKSASPSAKAKTTTPKKA